MSEEALKQIQVVKEPRERAKPPKGLNVIAAKAFERECLPFGTEYKGWHVVDVPKDYLEKVARGSFYEEFMSNLRRYVESDRFKGRQS